jgi:hypothetical protein
MKTIFSGIFMIIFFGVNFLRAQRLEKVWQTTADLKTSESVLFDEDDLKLDLLLVPKFFDNKIIAYKIVFKPYH